MHGWKMLAAVAAANFQLNALAFAQPHSLGDTLITEWLTCTPGYSPAWDWADPFKAAAALAVHVICSTNPIGRPNH